MTIPEIEDFTHYNPRQLMRPDTKLLAAAPEAEAPLSKKDSGAPELPEEDDPELQAYLTKMAADFLKRKQKKVGPKAPLKGDAEMPNIDDADANE